MAVTIIKKGAQSDPVIVKEQHEALKTLLLTWGPANFMMYFMWILGKTSLDAEGTVLRPFKLNRIQENLIDNLQTSNLLLKARQMGGTTFMMLFRLLLRAVTEQGFRGLFVSQKQFYANQHFMIIDRARRTFGMQVPGAGPVVNHIAESLNKHLLKRRLANRRELLFENLDSLVVVDSAQNKEAGQGFTINGFVGSEFSRWPNDPAETLANIRGSLSPGASCDLECTANGAQGPFYKLVNSALDHQGIYNLNFYEWWWTDEYSLPLDEDQRIELVGDLQHIDASLLTEKETHIRQEEITDTQRDEAVARHLATLSLEQIAWRRATVSADPKAFRENYPEDPRTCFLTEGNSYFDNELVARRMLELKDFKPYKIGRNAEAILFWKPRANVEYLIGADVSEGASANDTGSDLDYSDAWVIDLKTGEQVAEYRARCRPDQFAVDLATLGRMYNNAQIAVERNSYGTATLLFLETNEMYPNLYYHPAMDELGEIGGKLGFPTSVRTRPIALAYLQKWVEENIGLVWSSIFCGEALSFIRTAKGRPQAAPGAHDDSVAAGWVAHGARAFHLGFWLPLRPRGAQGDDDA